MLSNNEIALWTSIAAAGGAVLSGGVTGYITYRVTNRQVTSAELIAAKQRAHELESAKEERDQQRILDAYTSITRHVQNWGRPIGWQLGAIRHQNEPSEAAPKLDRLDFESEAVASLVASAEVGALLRDFNKQLRRYMAQLQTWTQAESAKSTNPGQASIERGRLEKVSEETLDIADRLIQQMRSELGAKGTLPTSRETGPP